MAAGTTVAKPTAIVPRRRPGRRKKERRAGRRPRKVKVKPGRDRPEVAGTGRGCRAEEGSMFNWHKRTGIRPDATIGRAGGSCGHTRVEAAHFGARRRRVVEECRPEQRRTLGQCTCHVLCGLGWLCEADRHAHSCRGCFFGRRRRRPGMSPGRRRPEPGKQPQIAAAVRMATFPSPSLGAHSFGIFHSKSPDEVRPAFWPGRCGHLRRERTDRRR